MLARKPLFTIGVSDIGTTSQDIERSLADVFELASTWKAVLLMQVAFIFLHLLGCLGILVDVVENENMSNLLTTFIEMKLISSLKLGTVLIVACKETQWYQVFRQAPMVWGSDDW